MCQQKESSCSQINKQMFDASSFCLLHTLFHPFLKICLRGCRSISFMAGYKPNKAKHQLAVHAIFVDWEEAYQFCFITWYNRYCVPLCVAQKHISWPIKCCMTFLVLHKIRAASLKFFCYFHASSKGSTVCSLLKDDKTIKLHKAICISVLSSTHADLFCQYYIFV